MRQAIHQEAVPNSDIFPITEGPMHFAEPATASAAVRTIPQQHQTRAQEKARQAVRMQRLLLACLFASLYLAAVAIFYSQALVDRGTLMVAAALVVGGIALFSVIFVAGINQKAAEKNLTLPIALCALGAMLWVLYRAPVTGMIFAPFVFVMLAYAIYRLPKRTILTLSAGTLAAYASVVGAHYWQSGNIASIKLELLHWLVLLLTLPGFVLLTGRVQRLHSALHRAGMKIRNIEEHARRDQLTACFNRRYMVAALEEQKRIADETGTPMCLAVLDLDHFKHINDEIGHLAGDEVLRTFAHIAQSNVRQGDIFGRYGGEEFLLVLPETPLLAALNIAERLREQVEHHAWAGKLQGQVTVSIGLTQYIVGESVLDLFSRTDTAMYLAKRGGRNQVVVEEPAVELWKAATADQ